MVERSKRIELRVTEDELMKIRDRKCRELRNSQSS